VAAQPTGTVTLLFSDIEGSTRLVERLGAERYAELLELHRRLLREAFARHSGYEVGTEGDSFFIAFGQAEDAVAAAGEAQRALAEATWPEETAVRVRIGVHTGEPAAVRGNYVGMDVHRAARIMAAAHGGQVLLSQPTRDLLDPRFAVCDLGEHRFKDLAAPERVFQLGEASFPPIRSLYLTNLPVISTPFLGREREVTELAALVSREETRLVTVMGPGGAGKTRLALQAVAEVSERFPDGIRWVALAPLREPSALEATVAQALGVTEQGHPFEAIVATYAGRQALLLLDNCEHLVDACASLVRRLLEGCARLVIVCSSRERLGLRGEVTYQVPPMTTSDAVQLFVERARAVQARFESDEHVAAICEAVDELPLAIELAAARVRSMSTRSIRDRLTERLPLLTSRAREVDERQRTLEATIAWSYNLLDTDERRVLRALSVFAGGCTLEAAESVAGADLEQLESLLDKSLLGYLQDEAGEDRYWLLETIREFAHTKLREESEDGEVRERQRLWFLRAAEQVTGDGFIHTGSEVPFFKADRANFRLVLLEALKDEDTSTALSLVAALAHLWHRAGEVSDGYDLARSALALPDGDDATRGRALHLAGDMAVDLAKFSDADALLEQAEEIAHAHTDTQLLWRVQYTRAYRFLVADDTGKGVEFAAIAADQARALGSSRAITQSTHMLIQALRFQATANPDEPDVSALERCLTLAEQLLRDTDSALGQASAHGEMAAICLALERPGDALLHTQSELRLRRDSVGSRQTMTALLLAGFASGALGQHEAAVTLAAATLAAYEAEGYAPDGEDRRALARLEHDAQIHLDARPYSDASERGHQLPLDEAVEFALNLSHPHNVQVESSPTSNSHGELPSTTGHS
jgi:predicted ATPase/class 3 adenylate cyclase